MIVLLLITYRSPVLWLFPVISAGIALVSAEALIYLLAAHAGLTVNAQKMCIRDSIKHERPPDPIAGRGRLNPLSSQIECARS